VPSASILEVEKYFTHGISEKRGQNIEKKGTTGFNSTFPTSHEELLLQPGHGTSRIEMAAGSRNKPRDE